jgi:diamine N-acetyltransferase
MFLKGKQIGLRAAEPQDIEQLYIWENDINSWLVSNTQIPISKFVLEEFVNAAHNDFYTNKQLRLIIVDLVSNKNIGLIDLFEFEPQHLRCGLGVFVDPLHRRNGAATEALELIKQYCFDVLHLNQIFVNVLFSNLSSKQLFEKNGFEKCGNLKRWHKISFNHFEDVCMLQCFNSLANTN